MDNYWVDKIRIKDAVKLIQDLLNDEFRGTIPNHDDFLNSFESIVDMLYKDDIVILDGLAKYEIVYQIDENNLVDKIELLKNEYN